MASILFPSRTSFTSWIDRCCPMASGVSASGNGTLSFNGSTGRVAGSEMLAGDSACSLEWPIWIVIRARRWT